MDDETRGRIRGTLTDVRYAEAKDEDFERVIYENLMQPLEARIADLERQLAETDTKARGYEQETWKLLNQRDELRLQLAEQWTPVKDGEYGTVAMGDSYIVENDWLTVQESPAGSDSVSVATIALSPNIRLCRQTPAPE